LKEQKKTSPESAFISIGSNISPEKHLLLAAQRLHELGRLLRISNVYQNPPVGRPEQTDFLNVAALVETNLSPLQIRILLRRIEAALGRIRSEDKYAPRTMDLDLCLLGNVIINTAEMTLPDPDLLTRGHLAIPLAELDPDFVHPITGESLQEIANRLNPSVELILREDVTEQIHEAIENSLGDPSF